MKIKELTKVLVIVSSIVLLVSQTSCLFKTNEVKFDLVRTDTIGTSKGEIGYIAGGEIYIQNPAGAPARQVSFDGVNKQGLILRNDRKQAISSTISAFGYPKVVNFDPNLSTLNLSTQDYATPNSFGYVGLDTLYFLTPNNAKKFISDKPSYTTYITNRINSLVSAGDSLKYLTISRKNDLVLVVKIRATGSYKFIWETGNNTVKTYLSSQELRQPKWSPDANVLVFRSERGVFVWQRAEDLPKLTIFEQNISAFALNPIGSEIAYTTGNDTIHIRNLSFSKSNRSLGTLPSGTPIRDIDWK